MVSVYRIYRYCMMFSMQSIVRVGLNEPHTSEKDGKSIVLTKIIVEIWISGTNVMHLQKYVYKSDLKPVDVFIM